MPAHGEHHPAFEEYCECIFELGEDDVEVIQARIAERLQISRPAVSEMMKRLEAEGLITSDDGIELTAIGSAARRAGRSPASPRRALPHRHPEAVVGRRPPRGRHAGSTSSATPSRQAINDLLGDPTTCPHGNPIPGSNYQAPDSAPLSEVLVGVPFTVRRITEELEFAPGLLEFLEESAIQPGNVGTVTAASPDGTLTVEIDGRHVGVGSFASERILVTT